MKTGNSEMDMVLRESSWRWRVEELGQSSLSGLADKEDPNLGSESLRMTATGVYVFANSNSFTCLISF